jgi:hypothetical protein
MFNEVKNAYEKCKDTTILKKILKLYYLFERPYKEEETYDETLLERICKIPKTKR